MANPEPLVAVLCLGLSVLVLTIWLSAAERFRLRDLVGRLYEAPSVRPDAIHLGSQSRGQQDMVQRVLGLDVPPAGLWGLFGLSAVLGIATADLAGLSGWQCLFAGVLGPFALIVWRLAVTGRRGEVLARQAHALLQDAQLAAAGGETAAMALSQAVANAKEPLRRMLTGALRAHSAGEPLAAAMSRIYGLSRCAEYRMLLDALRLHAETECSLGQLLGEAVDRADEALLSRRELNAKLGEAKWTARILAFVPLFLIVYLSIFSPSAIAPLRDDPVGRHGLLLGGGLWLCGILVAARMQQPPDRLRPGA